MTTAGTRAVVRYHAVSILSSRTFWANTIVLVVAVLSATEVVQIIPPRFVPTAAAVVAALNIYLRTITVRPVSFIAPGTTTPVLVERLGPPSPPPITD